MEVETQRSEALGRVAEMIDDIRVGMVTTVDELWSPMAKPWFPLGPDDPDLVLLHVITEGAEYWDAASSKLVRALATAASIVSGRPVGMGDHGKLNA